MHSLLKSAAFAMLAVLTLASCKQSASEKVQESKVALAESRDNAQKNVPVMTFEKTEHDFGRIQQNTPQEYTFEFTNTGKAPLIITDTKTSCGCTTPKVPSEPIAPGEKSEIVVRFNGSGKNQVSKSVTIMNNTYEGSQQLTIKAFVEAAGDS